MYLTHAGRLSWLRVPASWWCLSSAGGRSDWSGKSAIAYRVISFYAGYYAQVGERDKALEQIRRLPADETDPHVLVFAAVVYTDLGDRAAALTLLERASGHGLAANELRDWIELDPLKDEPRFAALTR